MDMDTRGWIVQGTIGAALGLLLGLVIGWALWPVQYTNTSPAVLRQDHYNDYVLMVAAAYEVDGDLGEARQRLALLDPEEPGAPVVELGERLIERNGSDDEIARLADLAWALGSITPPLLPYVGGPP